MSANSTTLNNTVWITNPETTFDGNLGEPDKNGTVHRLTLSCHLRLTAPGVGHGEAMALLALADALDAAGINEWLTEGPQPHVTVERY
jgi:hypothetical protein